jgi:SAM-dependent methyltransferase
MLLQKSSVPSQFVAKFRERLKVDAPDLIGFETENKKPENFSFDEQWSIYKYGNISWELDISKRVKYVYHYLRMMPGELNGKLVLDAGCGNGTLSAGLAASGPEVVALDYSDIVERAEYNKRRFAGDSAERLHYVQGDVQNPPFAKEGFDVVYSDGVLHHTSSTRLSFGAVASLLKNGGRMFVWLYRRDLSLGYRIKKATVEIIQALLRPLPLRVIRVLCYLGAMILLTKLRVQHLFGFNKSRRIIPVWLKAVNLFDTFTPRYNHHHTPEEVSSWFLEESFPHPVETTIPSLGQMGFGILAVRKNSKNDDSVIDQ